MITKTHDLALQITEPDYIKTGIKLVSRDNLTNILNIKIYDNNVEIDYSKVHHANIIFAKPDGTFVQGNLVKVSSGYTYTVGTNDTAAPGNVVASVQLYGASGERLSTARFSFQVIVDLLNPAAVESTTEFDILEQLRQELEAIDVVNLTNNFNSHLSESAQYIASKTQRDLFPEIIDLHYGILRGVGWNALETGGEITKTITVAATKGAYLLTLNDVIGIVPGQLIVICSDDKYYTNVVNTISGSDVTFNYPLETNISIGDTLHNFYINSTHPNIFGYKAKADVTIRDLVKPRGYRLLSRILPSDYTFTGTGTDTNGGFVQNYTEPFAVFDTKVLTETRQGIKVITLDNDCYLKIKTYLKTVEGAIINFQISNTGNNISYCTKNYSNLGHDTSDFIETVIFLRKGSYNLKIKNTVAGKSVVLGKTEIYELSTRYDAKSFDHGTHLLLGDSWFEIETLPQRLAEKFPHATFINFGVGGNKLDNLIRRFTGTATDADIKNDPATYGDRKDATLIPVIDYVWVLSSTNDYNASKPSATYKTDMDSLINAIIDRGAKPLIFTSSVGSIADSNNFTLSRQYADLFYNQQYNAMINKDSFMPIIVGSTTAGNNTYNIQTGSCKKIGSVVHFALTVRMSVKDTALAGNINISGLPYNPVAVTPVTLGRADYVTYNTGKQLIAQIETSGLISVNKIVDNGFFVPVAAADVANNTLFTISGSYLVD